MHKLKFVLTGLLLLGAQLSFSQGEMLTRDQKIRDQQKSNFETVSKIMKKEEPNFIKTGNCGYDLEKTFVKKYQQSEFCGGVEIKLCDTTIKCELLDKNGKRNGWTSYRAICPAVANGKCPLSHQDCEKNQLQITLQSEAAVALPGKDLKNQKGDGASKQ